MALQLKYADEHGVVHIDMSPTADSHTKETITDPKFDTINSRFAQYDLFGGKYDSGGDTPRSLFRSRYNSIEEELANTPYAFTSERSLRAAGANKLDITIERLNDISPSRDIEDDRFFKKSNSDDDSLFGPQIDYAPSFTVTQLIHAQDRYFDLSGRSAEGDGRDVSGRTSGDSEEAFRVLRDIGSREAIKPPVVPTKKRNKESSFAILAEAPISRPSSPRSLPVDIRRERISPFRGRGFREETSRHNTPKTSAGNSRASSPPRRRTKSLSRIDNMATTATLPLPILSLSRPHSPRNFVKENIKEVRGLSELNREKHEAEAEQKRLDEEKSLLKEMGLLDKNKSGSRSVLASTSNSRSNSPSKIKIRSRSNSPSAILHYESIRTDSKEFVNPDDGIRKPVMHRSRLRPVSKSQPQSNDGSPKHSKIPKRQTSASPPPPSVRNVMTPTRPESSLSKNQKNISNSTNSIHETIKIGSQVHDKRRMSKSTQHLNISPAHIKSKPPISPGRNGPPPSNKTINSKRLSPIVGTPNKSPKEDLKPSSAKVATKPTPMPRKTVKTAGNTPATSRLNSRQSSRPASRDPSPEKRKALPKSTNNIQTKPVARTSSTRSVQKPTVPKTEPKKPINRTNSMKSLNRTPSSKNLIEKPPLKRNNSKKDTSEKALSTSKINEIGAKKDTAKDNKKLQKDKGKPDILSKVKKEQKKSIDATTEAENVIKQDNETQYDKITNEKGELVILTKKNIISMTTAAITSQPLQVVTTVTNQLPAALEKAREKGLFERLSSKDSLTGKDNDGNAETKEKDTPITTEKEAPKEKETIKEKPKEKEIHKEIEPKIIEPKETTEEKEVVDEKKPVKTKYTNFENKTLFNDDHIKLRPLQPPYNNPQVERVKQKIDDILKEPEVSTENILTASAKSREANNTFKNITDKSKMENKEDKDDKKDISNKFSDIKDQVVKENEKITEEIRSEATKIVDSIITPVEAPKDIKEKINNFTESIKNVPEKLKNLPKKIEDVKKDIVPIVMVVNEKKNDGETLVDKVNKTVVTGGGEVEVQSSNLSTPGVQKMAVQNKMADGNVSDKSAQSNGGFPQSTSTTPKPPARARKEKDKSPSSEPKPPQEPLELVEPTEDQKPPNFCQRLINKCKTKCCTCCVKEEDGKKEREEKRDSRKQSEEKDNKTEKKGMMNKLNCCKKDVQEETEQDIRNMELAAGKASIQYEDEMKHKRKLRDVLCGCCGRKRRVSDTSASIARNIAGSMSPAPGEEGCCGRQKRTVERRDSILSDRPPTSCCNNALCRWARGACRRGSEPSSRRTSMFSKNKSLSPTLPPEDTRKKLDTSLVEHTSVMRGAIPVLPIALAYFCLVCNILVPGLGTIFSGMFCLCFGIPRFGVHDGAKHRIGSFVINLLVGCGQLFTVLFCLVGWGWSIWWGVIMVRISRKYRKLKAEVDAAEAEAPPVTANNHTRT